MIISYQIREAERRNNEIIETWEQERRENTGQNKRRRGAEKPNEERNEEAERRDN